MPTCRFKPSLSSLSSFLLFSLLALMISTAQSYPGVCSQSYCDECACGNLMDWNADCQYMCSGCSCPTCTAFKCPYGPCPPPPPHPPCPICNETCNETQQSIVIQNVVDCGRLECNCGGNTISNINNNVMETTQQSSMGNDETATTVGQVSSSSCSNTSVTYPDEDTLNACLENLNLATTQVSGSNLTFIVEPNGLSSVQFNDPSCSYHDQQVDNQTHMLVCATIQCPGAPASSTLYISRARFNLLRICLNNASNNEIFRNRILMKKNKNKQEQVQLNE